MAAQSAVMSMLVLLAVASFAAAAVQVVTEYGKGVPAHSLALFVYVYVCVTTKG